eukprot:CAMPEP_0181295844 /NCGR_PEP_ID=MMETSP1101-20121128/4368_1 /TAXON_ID=46948 /ORGANISM="Rhodomonas abbreviata, Strain Caron Lab Isolate" /LENGTH=394 /DNA_ID=CAMNT_0023400631 /DNA_START=138 /DNA_END=1318 /DNA_ORIENTATION=-
MTAWPAGLLGHIWPAERVVIGLRVCRWLRRELVSSKTNILFLGPKKGAACNPEDIAKSVTLFSDSPLQFTWRRQPRKLITGLDLAFATGTCHCIARLDFSYNRMRAAGLKELARVIGQCRTLTHLDLSGNLIRTIDGAPKLCEILEQCHGLTYLNLSRNIICSAGTRVLCDVLQRCKLLTSLNLSRNSISGDALGRIFEVLAEMNSFSSVSGGVGGRILATLDLSSNNLSIRGTAIASMTHGLPMLKGLQELNLAEISMNCRCICEVLDELKDLRSLDLSRNNINDGDIEILTTSLSDCPNLSHLHLAENRIRRAGASKLAVLLQKSRALAYLDLDENDVGDAGATALAEVLGACGTLTHLSLRKNDVGDEGARSLIHALEQRQRWMREEEAAA